MDYPLENLGPERFQRVCQALLVKEFPRARLLPLSGRDGGRDAFVALGSPGRRRRNSVIFQVKYARDPAALDNPRKWVRDAIKKEMPKIQELVKLGAQHYRLITNVRGSGHLKTGSIDLLDTTLEELPIPADGWWRDDLLGRLDSSWDIKWAFPELFTGPDLLRAIIENGLSEDFARRSSAISTFLADQYEVDSRVKFKQVELENHLLDLYVDVQMTPGDAVVNEFREVDGYVVTFDDLYGRRVFHQNMRDFYGDLAFQRHPVVGAASLLLDESLPRASQWLVLEGAPGQGKSTVTQYICQIHRMRLLHRDDDIALVNPNHLKGPLRLPFRVDLRDLASWLHARNPFGDPEDTSLNPKRSLETFLAAQVENASGGASFSVADLHAVTRVSSLLLVLDGLDEVADIGERERVVTEVSSALRRLRQIAPSLQAVVTSRPAAFENSPGFAKAQFAYYKLIDLDRDLISNYATKWIDARNLRPREASNVRSVLSSKLDQPHMRDLARNPMQLAILLSLIHRRGPSLPDKRTALYDSYVNTFFDREAEKTEDVQRYRDLLVEIHQYLAWRLQAEVETGNSQGSITESALRQMLYKYLEEEEKDPNLLSVLFKSLVERVVAIVSRVQGTYEFEVRPLQEYFAARFLYDTARYSPPGAEGAGDKTDRFDALARNFYWLNVTRFYAGCYSKGELPSLADRLQVLDGEIGFKDTNHPRVLAGILLSDWVFAQHPRSVKGTMTVLLRNFATRGISGAEHSPTILPEGSGRDELAALCWQLADVPMKVDRAPAIIATLAANCSNAAVDAGWADRLATTSGTRRTEWVKFGLWLGALDRAPESKIIELMDDTSCDANRLSFVARSKHEGLIDAQARQLTKYVDGLLDGEILLFSEGPPEQPATLARALRFVFSVLPQIPHPSHWPPEVTLDDDRDKSETAHKCETFLQSVKTIDGGHRGAWTTSLAPWNVVIEAMRSNWGDRWLAVELAITAAGVRAAQERGQFGGGLFDGSIPLCERVRYARLRAGAGKWWCSQLRDADTELDELLVVASFFTWAGEKTIRSHVGEFDAWVQQTSSHKRMLVQRAIGRATGIRYPNEPSGSPLDARAVPKGVSPTTASLLMVRCDSNEALKLGERCLLSYTGNDPMVLDSLAATCLLKVREEGGAWHEVLPMVSRAYENDVVGHGGLLSRYRPFALERGATMMPRELARVVLDHAASYPLDTVAQAEAAYRVEVGESVVSLAEVAKTQGWDS
jgi:hypothetical protein